MFAASHRDKSHALGILVTKEGYYENRQKYDMGGADHYNQTKWNPSITVALRKIGKLKAKGFAAVHFVGIVAGGAAHGKEVHIHFILTVCQHTGIEQQAVHP